MATPAQIKANHENSQRSTGPRSQPGKARSAANSNRHGLSAAYNVLPNENLAEYDGTYEGYMEEFAPEGFHETFLVQQMIHARWRILRIERLELRLLSDAAVNAATPDDADSAILSHMREKGVDVATALQRYRGAAERCYFKAHRELTIGRVSTAQTASAEVRRDQAEAGKVFMDFLSAPPPSRHPLAEKLEVIAASTIPSQRVSVAAKTAPLQPITLKSNKPVEPPSETEYHDKSTSGPIEISHANRQSAKAVPSGIE